MKIRIVILINEEEYGVKIGEYLASINSNFDIFVIQNYFDSKEIELILSEQDIAIIDDENNISNYLKISKETKLKFIFLTENIEKLKIFNSENFIILRKYDSVKNIIQEIEYLNVLAKGSIAIIPKRQNVKIYVITSGAGGTGKSSIAISLSRDLSKRLLKKVLYLNMESIQIYDSYFTDMEKGKRNISDFLYYLFKKSDEEKRISSTKSFIFVDSFGVNTFYPSGDQNQFSDLNLDEIKFVFDKICETNEFEFIVVDLGVENLEILYFLYNYSNNLLLIYDKSNFTQNKNNKLKDILIKKGSENLSEKIIKIVNKKDLNDFAEEGSLIIEYDPSSFRLLEYKIDISYHGNFFVGIRGITDYLIKTTN
jgi:GTPase SAR1 family protein